MVEVAGGLVVRDRVAEAEEGDEIDEGADDGQDLDSGPKVPAAAALGDSHLFREATQSRS